MGETFGPDFSGESDQSESDRLKYVGGEGHLHTSLSNLPESQGPQGEIARHEADYQFKELFNYAREIIDQGSGKVQFLVVAEHPSDSSKPEKMVTKEKAEELLSHFEKINTFNTENRARGIEGPRIVAGIEADIVSQDGGVNVPEKVLENCELVIASKHALGQLYKDQNGNPREPNAEELTRMYLGLMNNPHVDMIGHLNRYVSEDTLRAMDWKTLFVVARNTKTILEINAGAPMPSWLIKEAVRNGVPLMIGTDAHDLMRYRNLPEERKASTPEASFSEIQEIQRLPEAERRAVRERRLKYGPGLHYWWKLLRPLKALEEAEAPASQLIGSSWKRLQEWISVRNKFERKINWGGQR